MEQWIFYVILKHLGEFNFKSVARSLGDGSAASLNAAKKLL